MFKKTYFNVNIYIALLYRIISLMLIFSLCRLGFYLINKDLFDDLSLLQQSRIFLGGLKFDIVAIIYFNILYILLQIIPWKLKYNSLYQNISKWIFIVFNAIAILFNFVDFAYYKFTLKRTTFTVFNQFSEEQNLSKLFIQFIIDYWYLTLFYILFIYVLIHFYNIIKIKVIKKFSPKTYLFHTLAMILVVGLCVIGVRGGWRHSTRPITLSNAGEFVSKPAEMSIVLNTPFTLIKTIGSSVLTPVNYFNDNDLVKLYNPINYPEQKTFNKKNVVIIIVESLGREHIGGLNKNIQNGKYKGYTPFLDSLIDHSFIFPNSYANGRKSIDALPSIISGIPSINEPYVLSPYSGNKTTSIAKLLANEGYETSFFHGAPNGSMGFSSYINLAGVKNYYGKTEYNNDDDFDGIWGIWDDPFLQFMAKKLNTFKTPFFSAVFTVSSHHPFKVPAKYEGKFPKGPLEVQETIGYTDMALRNFFNAVKNQPWYKNTLFVITADHATVSYLPEYQTVAGDFSVPIFLYTPDGSLVGKSDNLIQQIDILPTVLNYLNYPKPFFSFGFNAFSEKNDNFVINNNNGVYNFFKDNYLLLNNGKETIGLYDLSTDRLMKKNLKGLQPKQKDLENHFNAFIQQYTNRMINDELTLESEKN